MSLLHFKSWMQLLYMLPESDPNMCTFDDIFMVCLQAPTAVAVYRHLASCYVDDHDVGMWSLIFTCVLRHRNWVMNNNCGKFRIIVKFAGAGLVL